MKTPFALFLLGSLGLTGCYTQLHTRGYGERAAEAYPEYARGPQPQADTAAPADSASLARGGDTALADSSQAGRTGQSAYAGQNDRPEGPPPVIVNNYYNESPYYRGYPLNAWDYPSFTLGFYSSRYRDYTGAYWWDDPWYRGRGGYRGHVRYPHGGSNPPPSQGGGGQSGSYHSDKRLFSIVPDYSPPRKGRRSEPAANADVHIPPAPKVSTESNSGSSSSSSSSSSSESSSSSSDNSSSGSSGSSQGSSDERPHPNLQKGKRR